MSSLVDGVAGALTPGQTITWLSNGAPLSLVNATGITGELWELRSGTQRAIVGDLQVSDPPNGVFTWDYALADVVEGIYLVKFTAAFSSGPTPAKVFWIRWRCYP